MTTDQIIKLIAPTIAVIIGAAIKYFSTHKAKLVSFIGHISTFVLQDENKSKVFAHSVIVRNTGNVAANNVRLGHNVLPEHITVFPNIKHTIERNEDSSGEIVIPVLVPKEQITISYLYFPPTTWDQINVYTKSNEGLAKILNVIPVPLPAKLFVGTIWFLVFVGSSLLLYWLMKIILHFI